MLYWHRNRETKQCNPRHDTLAREMRCSVSSIRNWIRELREAGIILATKGRRGNRYEIRPHEEWRTPLKKTPTPTPCPSGSGQPEFARRDDFILNERETLFLNNSVSGVAASFPGANGGGGAPAEPKKNVHPGQVASSPCEPSGKPPTRENREAAAALVQELLPNHPQPGNPGGAVKQIERVLAEGATPDQIRASHTQWRKMWAVYREGRFIPMLWRWIHDNDWRYPPEEKQIKSNTDPNREREAADKIRMEAAKAAAEARRPEDEARARRKKLRAEIEANEDIVSGRSIWPTPTPELIETARRRLAELRGEVAA